MSKDNQNNDRSGIDRSKHSQPSGVNSASIQAVVRTAAVFGKNQVKPFNR